MIGGKELFEELLKLEEMTLHQTEVINNGEYRITRVPNGWLYCREEPQEGIANPVFVPIKI